MSRRRALFLLASAAAVSSVISPPALADEKAAHGAVVVAIGDSAAAAHALARDVYKDEALRPAIDETTADVLAGDEPKADAPAKLKELAELRASVAKADSEIVARRLLASMGAEAHAEIVIEVIAGEQPTAKVLRVASGAFEGVSLGAAVGTNTQGQKTYTWPSAAAALHGLVHEQAKPPVAPSTSASSKAPLKPEKEPMPGSKSPVKAPDFAWTSPWFWVSLGALSAAGVTVFVLSRTSGPSGNIHVAGEVPR